MKKPYTLICHVYDVAVKGIKALKKQWIEEANDDDLVALLDKYQIEADFQYPTVGSITKIEGPYTESFTVIEIHIIRF